MIQQTVLEQIEEAIKRVFGEYPTNLDLSFPPKFALGQFALPCHTLGKQFGISSQEAAAKIAEAIEADWIEACPQGSFLNLKIVPEKYFWSIIAAALCLDRKFGASTTGEGKKAMVECLSPNTNKPLHVGHARNGCLGISVANLLKFAGYEVVLANLINDRGIHICKSMLAWQLWADGQTPDTTGMKGDHFVGDLYVRFSRELEEEIEQLRRLRPDLADADKDVLAEQTPIMQRAKEMLLLWEAGDPEIIALWELMNNWVYAGFDQTCAEIGFTFDQIYYESKTYKLGKDIIEVGLAKGVFERDPSGAIVAILPATVTIIKEDGTEQEVVAFGTNTDGSPRQVTVLRADGTSVYMTQDLGTAELKFAEYDLDTSIYVVASEQDHHFEVLFFLLKLLGYKWAKQCYHLSYGMVNLPSGRMKSREGNVVDLDDLIREMRELAAKEIASRSSELSQNEIERRARVITDAAIKFYLTVTTPKASMMFDPEQSIQFEGRTGPYCLYAYVRANAVIRNAAQLGLSTASPDYAKLGTDEELLLARALMTFPEQIAKATEKLEPSIVAMTVFELARAFHNFYTACPITQVEDRGLGKARLDLTQAAMIAIRNGLNLLNINVLEQM